MRPGFPAYIKNLIPVVRLSKGEDTLASYTRIRGGSDMKLSSIFRMNIVFWK